MQRKANIMFLPFPKGEPMRLSKSPITWFVAFLLMVGTVTAALLFMRTDFGAVPMGSPAAPPAAATGVDVPTILVVAMTDKVEFKEFSSMRQCSEAATYVRIGTERRATAECVTK